MTTNIQTKIQFEFLKFWLFYMIKILQFLYSFQLSLALNKVQKITLLKSLQNSSVLNLQIESKNGH